MRGENYAYSDTAYSRLESSESLPWKVQTSQVYRVVILFATNHSLEKSLNVMTEEEK
jgi:hypothetical protein